MDNISDEQLDAFASWLMAPQTPTYGVFQVNSNDGKAPGFHIIYELACDEAASRSQHNDCGVGCGVAFISEHDGYRWNHNTAWANGECVEDMDLPQE